MRRFLMGLWAFVFTCTLAPVAMAQVVEITTAALGVASSALAGKAVKDILGDARLKVSQLIAEAERSGNNLLLRAADELNVSIENATRLLGAELDKTFDRLDESERRMLAGIAVATSSAESIADKAYLAKDTLALDMRSILGSLPLTREVFVLQRVSGLTQLERAGDYRMQLIGSYVGTPASGYKTEISLKLAGKPLEGFRLDPSALHVTDIIIPSAALSSHFQPEKIAVVELEIVVAYTHPSTFLFFFDDEETNTTTTKLHLVLYPSYAGEFNFTSDSILYGWKDVGSKSDEYIGPNAHCDSNCEGHYGIPASFDMAVSGGNEPPLEGDQRIVNVNCYQSAGHNPFDADLTFSILNPTRARCSFRARTHPTTYKMDVQLQQWGKIDEVKSVESVKLHYDQMFEFRVPASVIVIRITGTILTGERVDFLIDDMDSKNPVQLVKREANGSGFSYFVRPIRPQDLDF